MKILFWLLVPSLALARHAGAANPPPPASAPADAGATMSDYQWWRDARFGIFIHWGPGALVHKNAFSWEPRPEGEPSFGMQGFHEVSSQPSPEITSGEWKKYIGRPKMPAQVYDDLSYIFNPTKFDATAWAKLFKASGAGYVIFTTKHHDGFAMWDSKYTDHNIMNTPFHRDICQELADACHKEGLRVIWYYSKWDAYELSYNVKNPRPYADYVYNQVEELLTKYGAISGLWWDGGQLKIPDDEILRIFTMAHRLQPGLISNGRLGKVPGVTFATPEQRLGTFNLRKPWETCAVIEGSSWIWNGGRDVKSLGTCLRMLIDCAGGDGNLALDFGPTPEGEIFQPFQDIYLGMGRWLKQYGESIYRTRGGPYRPGEWGVSTRRDSTVYLHVTEQWPGGVLTLPALPARIVSCRSLTGGEPQFKQTDESLEIRLDPKDHTQPDTIIALTLDRDALGLPPIATLAGRTLTTDAKVTASSSINAESGLGAPETVVGYSWETGRIARQFGEDGGGSQENAVKPAGIEVDWPVPADRRIRKIIGTNQRGHFSRYWMPAPGDARPWIEVNLGRPRTFQRVGLRELYGKIRAYQLQFPDGAGWRTFFTGGTIDTLSVYLTKSITTQRVRLLITKTDGGQPSIVAFDLFPPE